MRRFPTPHFSMEERTFEVSVISENSKNLFLGNLESLEAIKFTHYLKDSVGQKLNCECGNYVAKAMVQT